MNLDSLEFKLYAGELLAVIAFMIILFFKNKPNKDGWVVVSFGVLVMSLMIIYRAIGLLYYSEEVTGITKGVKSGYKTGSSIHYEYQYQGTHETGSNGIPSNLDSIKTMNGKYKVRVFNGMIRVSWMDFSKPVE